MLCRHLPALLSLPLLETVRLAPNSSVLPSWRKTITCSGKHLVVLSLMVFDGYGKGAACRRAKLMAIVRFRKLARADTICIGKLADPPPAFPAVVEAASSGIARY